MRLALPLGVVNGIDDVDDCLPGIVDERPSRIVWAPLTFLCKYVAHGSRLTRCTQAVPDIDQAATRNETIPIASLIKSALGLVELGDGVAVFWQRRRKVDLDEA